MIVFLHVLIALTSIGHSSYAFIRPSNGKLKASYGLLVATLASGTFLVVSTHARMIEACTMGLLYSGFVVTMLSFAQRKLARQKALK